MDAKNLLVALGLVLVLGLSVCRAENWTTTDGRVYQDIKVASFNDGYVSVIDNEGGARIPLRLLNADLQKQFHYDPTKAAACEAATRAQDEADAKAKLSAEKTPITQAPADGHIVISNRFSPLNSAPPYRVFTKPGSAVTPNDNPLSGLKINDDGSGPSSDAVKVKSSFAQPDSEGAYMVLAGQPKRKVISPLTPEEQAQFKKVYDATLAADSDLDSEGDDISFHAGNYRAALDAGMVKADPAVGALLQTSGTGLTQDQSDEIKRAESDALHADPNLQSQWDDLSKRMSDHQQKVDAAMIKLDPTVAPILAKLSP